MTCRSLICMYLGKDIEVKEKKSRKSISIMNLKILSILAHANSSPLYSTRVEARELYYKIKMTSKRFFYEGMKLNNFT